MSLRFIDCHSRFMKSNEKNTATDRNDVECRTINWMNQAKQCIDGGGGGGKRIIVWHQSDGHGLCRGNSLKSQLPNWYESSVCVWVVYQFFRYFRCVSRRRSMAVGQKTSLSDRACRCYMMTGKNGLFRATTQNMVNVTCRNYLLRRISEWIRIVIRTLWSRDTLTDNCAYLSTDCLLYSNTYVVNFDQSTANHGLRHRWMRDNHHINQSIEWCASHSITSQCLCVYLCIVAIYTDPTHTARTYQKGPRINISFHILFLYWLLFNSHFIVVTATEIPTNRRYESTWTCVFALMVYFHYTTTSQCQYFTLVDSSLTHVIIIEIELKMNANR